MSQGVDPVDTGGALALPTAGHVSIRGGIVRLAGYGVGTVLGTATSILLLRYLGVRDFGRYATVTAIAAVVAGLADVGLSSVGQRDFVVLADPTDRRGLLADIVGIRLVLTPFAAAIGVAFAAAAGYSGIIVAGVAIGGIGVVLTLIAATILIPATAELRFVSITIAGLARDISGALALIVLVVVGASLFPFFTVATVAAAVAFGASVFIAGRDTLRARFAWATWKPIIVQALPLGLAGVIGVLYLRALLIVTSLTTTSFSTGLYAMSDRIVQVVVGGAATMISASFPIIARAGGRADEEGRLVYAQQQLFDVSVFAALLCVLVFAIAARPIVVLLGGDAYAGSAPILRIQCFALFGSFLGLTWLPALIAIRRQRALIVVYLVGLVTIAAVGGSLIPAFGIKGTAVSAVVGESAIAAAGIVALTRARPVLRPRLRSVAKLVLAAGVCALFALVPGLPAAAAAALAAGSYVAVAWFSGAVPRDPVDALMALRRRGS